MKNIELNYEGSEGASYRWPVNNRKKSLNKEMKLLLPSNEEFPDDKRIHYLIKRL